MLINLDNIKLEEYDLYTQDTETILNKKFMEEGYAVGGVTRFGNELFLKYYKVTNRPNTEEKYNVVIEENITFQYETKDYTIYVLKNIHQERITREVKGISLEVLDNVYLM